MVDTTNTFEQLDPKKYIIIKGARVNNLKSLSVAIPRNKLVVITGLSGSGKSSLAFDTLFAEGQRMYVESLNSYARQFLGRMEKPEADYIKGISPAIAVEQKVNTRNPRSTVGTTTEIYDYLKLLFARLGKTISPISGQEVRRNTVTDVVNFLKEKPEGQKFMVLAPLVIHQERTTTDELKILLQKGFSRVWIDEQIQFLEDILEQDFDDRNTPLFVLIDRNMVRYEDEDNVFRMTDSIQTAFYEGKGECVIALIGDKSYSFSDKFEADGITFEEPSVNFFSFNNPYGACKTCEGFGKILDIDEGMVIDEHLSVYDGAIIPWRSEKMKEEWLKPLLRTGIEFDFPIHRAYEDLDQFQKQLLWDGNEYFHGLTEFFDFLKSNTHQIKYRVMLSRYRNKIVCPDCRGTRLRKDAQYVKFAEKSISDIVLMPVEEAYDFFQNVKLNEREQKIAQRLLTEIRNRLEYLNQVGLGYLTLNRLTGTLSGGEFQRIKLATSLGSALVGSMYILDEPSIGLHPRDTQNLVSVLKRLRDLGNTVIVVEHEEEVIKNSDQIIDIGLDAGSLGGNLIFQGTVSDLMAKEAKGYTADYMQGRREVPLPQRRRKPTEFISIENAKAHNLKNISTKIPLHSLTVITGVSGSGKSTLIRKVLYPALRKHLGLGFSGEYESVLLGGNLKSITGIELIDQNPIGKSSRSNPVTYVKAYDAIRALFVKQPIAKQRGYKAGVFSFNTNGGRCEVCQGEGFTKVEMQFMADILLPCESCHGKRFKQEVLDVTYKNRTIADVLEMTVSDALLFFAQEAKIVEKLQPLADVGLGYIKLGQSSATLSGGEAQRVKLAAFLTKGNRSKEHLLFIFDEPTTGLHFHDIRRLTEAINALIRIGHTVIIIEHNPEIIKSADWLIDLGPEGGEKGGQVCFEGKPEDMIQLKDNHTANFIREKIRILA